ncbi:DUF1801 domain-containing protein [Sphingosinicella sp. CPCC 101087]|uniref:DUF1801 domain-containing protein n=1 Tax=Sphingosinicella sp. CPCC 101087 TaxID=2497754 RepID=UPI00101D412C|nr:DUF1801 domain-containing protein [Sphingosinicella sp. CPCC 101087]
MAELKTKPSEISVDAFLDAVPDPVRREDARKVRAMMERVSGEPARMWGPAIVGFGTYHYRYASGHEGDMCRIGFSPRAKELVLYLSSDAPRHQALMDRLGRHRTGKSCLYIKRLADVDECVLEALVAESLDHMRGRYPEGA